MSFPPTRLEARAAAEARLESVDVLRGLAIAGMILVNDAGDFEHVYRQLDHSPWNGLALADLVFPSFVFVMGVSIALSLVPVVEGGASRAGLARKIVRRALTLIGLGLFLNLYPVFHFEDVRATGVLQRIGLAYLAASAIHLALPRVRSQTLVALGLVVGYELLLELASPAGFGAGVRPPSDNLGTRVDHALLGAHFPAGFESDPEGLLATLPTIATALLGALAGRWLRGAPDPVRRVAGPLLLGAAGFAAGWMLDLWIPINKSLWSASFVLVTGGFGLALLGALHGVVDELGLRSWAAPLRFLGVNPIVIYVASSLLTTSLGSFVVIRADGREQTFHDVLYEPLTHAVASPWNASLLYALGFLALWCAVAAALHRAKIFVRV